MGFLLHISRGRQSGLSLHCSSRIEVDFDQPLRAQKVHAASEGTLMMFENASENQKAFRVNRRGAFTVKEKSIYQFSFLLMRRK